MKPVKDFTKAEVLAQASAQAAARADAEVKRIENEELNITFNQSVAKIRMPRHFSLQNLQKFSEALWSCETRKDIEIDFINTNVFNAESLLFIPHQIRNFSECNPYVGIHAINHKDISFAKTMGLLRMFGSGPDISVAGSQKKLHYLPISTNHGKRICSEGGYK